MPIYDSGTGLAKVASGVASHLADRSNTREQRQTDAAELKLRRNTANAANDPDKIENKVDALDAQNKDIIAKQLGRETTDKFRLYIKTGNTQHLTNLFKNNERLSKQFMNLIAVEPLDPEKDRALLAEKGISIEDYKPGFHLKGITSDGSTALFDAYQVALGTGAALDIMNEEADLMAKWLKANGKDGKVGTLSELGKDATLYAEVNDDVTFKQAVNKFSRKKLAGVEPGKQEEADKAVATLTSVFGGEEEYFATDFTDRKNRTMAASSIRRYEALSGVGFSATDKADLKDLNTLAVMASQVSETLTPEVTGFFDSTYRNVRNVLSDQVSKGNIEETQAQSAYAAFRNTTLHALSGATLTDGEIALFKEAFGSLSQQFPAVVTQFQNALRQTQSKLATVADLNDPYLAHYYMRNSPEDIGKMINNLDIVLEQFSQDQGNKPGVVLPEENTGNVSDPNYEDTVLEEIFGGFEQ